MKKRLLVCIRELLLPSGTWNILRVNMNWIIHSFILFHFILIGVVVVQCCVSFCRMNQLHSLIFSQLGYHSITVQILSYTVGFHSLLVSIGDINSNLPIPPTPLSLNPCFCSLHLCLYLCFANKICSGHLRELSLMYFCAFFFHPFSLKDEP